MILMCPKCGKGYTIPSYDTMKHNKTACDCGCPNERFSVVGLKPYLPQYKSLQY